MKKVNRQTVRRDLLQQMEKKGLTGAYFRDLADQYAVMYESRCLLEQEISASGVMSVDGNGNPKPAPALMSLLKVNKAMNDMLKNLGLNAPDKNQPAPQENDEL